MSRAPFLLASAAVAAFSLSACQQNKDEAPQDPATSETAAGVESPTPATVEPEAGTAVTSSADYAASAAIGDLFEIESSELAQQKSQSEPIKKFARQIIEEHSGTTQRLKTALAASGLNITLPTALDERHQELLNELKEAAPAAFDTRFADIQTQAHREALALHQGYAQAGDNPQLKQFAAETASKIQGHLEGIHSLDAAEADKAGQVHADYPDRSTTSMSGSTTK